MRNASTCFLALLAALAPASVGAQDRRHDQDAVRQAVQRGDIKSLTDILGALRNKLPGEIVGVEIEQKRGRWVYEFRVADKSGRLFEVYVNAQSGEIEQMKEK
jgi:uncharacterized membrane protein YkoI